MLDSADPIWRHVKTEWDHQFVKRANFIPWLRAQLQVDPIDETTPAPEPLLNYVKRRLALAQHQQRLRETVNGGQAAANSSASPPLAQGSAGSNSSLGPTSASSNRNGTYLEANPTSSIAAPNSYPGHSPSFAPSQTSQPTDRACLAVSAGPHLYDHGTSNSPSISNSQLLAQASAPSTCISYSSNPLPPSTNTFSSQLGAIADAHMGNSSSMMSASCMPPTPRANGFHCDPDDSRNTTQYFQTEAQAQQYQQAQLLLMRQEHEQINRIQQHQRQLVSSSQQHPTHLSSFPSSLPSSSYVDHSAPSNPTLAFTLSHSHPLQPQNVNHYMQAIRPNNVAPYQQFAESQKKSLKHQENAFSNSDGPLEFGGTIPVTEPNPWHPGPLVQIDPTLMAGYGTAYGLRLPIDSPSLPPISPAVDVAPRVTTTAVSDLPSPRRTRSAAALIRKNMAANAVPPAPVPDKSSPRSPAEAGGGAASTAPTLAEGSSAPTITDPSDRNSPPNKTIHQKEKVDSPAQSTSNVPTDHYNRQAWKSRISTVRTELDHIPRAPARSASKLVKILSLYSVSPIPPSGDWSTVPPDGRIEVLSAIKANASQEFYNTWVSESKGLAMLEAWLKGVVHLQERAKPKETSGGATTDSEAARRETLLINLLQILAKFSLTVDNLKNHTFAKQVIRINKEQNANKFSDGVKRLSVALEQKWRAVVRGAAGPTPKSSGGHDVTSNPSISASDTKKRSETVSESNNNKKRKVEPVKIAIAATPSTSKSTSDLFGRPDKAKLPAFTKKVLEPSPAPVVVQDTFAEAMGLIKGKTTNAASPDAVPANSGTLGKTAGKPAKRVRFAADAELCQIKIVERLIYEGEEYETHPVGDARKMDAVEGRYLHLSDNFLEEEIEWETPMEVLLTPETATNLETSPLVSPEAEAQEARERSLAEVTYEDESQIPETPHEPASLETSEADAAESSGLPKTIKLPSTLMEDPEVSRMIAKAEADNSVDAPVAPDQTVSDLLARLGGVGGACPKPSNQQVSGFNLPVGFDINLLNSISQSGSLQALLAASSSMALPTQQPIPTPPITEPFCTASRDNPYPTPSGENPYPTTSRENTFPNVGRDNGWGAAAGSAARGREQRDSPMPYIPTGPSAGVSRHKRRKKGKEGVQPRISAHDSFGRHIKCKWWPNCPHGHKCFYKHG